MRRSCCPGPESAGEELLRTHGLRVTRPRLGVLTEGGHLWVDEITQRVRERIDAVSTQGIYDVLGVLSRAGLARRIEPAGSPARFEARVGDNDHHIVCGGCGTIEDVDCRVDERPRLEPGTSHGFEVDEAQVTFWGLWPACQALRVTDTAT
jgi:Fe2+ or Zn2+ uptake regulation protein